VTTRAALALLAALTVAGCTALRDDLHHGRAIPTGHGYTHGLVAAGATLGSWWLLDDPRWGAVGACLFYLGKETEESRVWTHYDSGRLDAALDVIVPCAVGGLLTVWIRGWK
jgi:hypothetical protein